MIPGRQPMTDLSQALRQARFLDGRVHEWRCPQLRKLPLLGGGVLYSYLWLHSNKISKIGVEPFHIGLPELASQIFRSAGCLKIGKHGTKARPSDDIPWALKSLWRLGTPHLPFLRIPRHGSAHSLLKRLEVRRLKHDADADEDGNHCESSTIVSQYNSYVN